MSSNNKLIVLRGPSASGKSTAAKLLFDKALNRTALIEQDHYRFIFKPSGGGSKANSSTIHKMIKHDVLLALHDGYDVILEGILSVRSYDKVLDELFAQHEGDSYIYYFDISFPETLKRHRTKPIAAVIDEHEMGEWYPAAHRSNHELEHIIPEEFSPGDTVQFIVDHSKLRISPEQQ